MAEITRALVGRRVGVDLSKRVFQVHAVDRAERRVLTKLISPERFYAWCAELPAGFVVVMEACGGAHHVARRLRSQGLDARLIAGHFVAPYRMAGKSGKNGANDAAAICEAGGRPHMRFVPVKTAEQQGQLAVHRLREGYKEERTALINRIRGLLLEFGLVFPKSPEALQPEATAGGLNIIDELKPTPHPDVRAQDAHHRSDRRQVNSVTLPCLEARERMEPCRAVRIRGLDEVHRHKPACRCAVCPSLVMPSSCTPHRSEKGIPLDRKKTKTLLTQWEVPVEALAPILSV